MSNITAHKLFCSGENNLHTKCHCLQGTLVRTQVPYVPARISIISTILQSIQLCVLACVLGNCLKKKIFTTVVLKDCVLLFEMCVCKVNARKLRNSEKTSWHKKTGTCRPSWHIATNLKKDGKLMDKDKVTEK